MRRPIDIQMPDYETRSAIITAKASKSGMELDPTVVEYLATNIKTNIKTHKEMAKLRYIP